MEDSRHISPAPEGNSEDSSEKKDKKKSKRSAENLGAFAIEPEVEKKKTQDKKSPEAEAPEVEPVGEAEAPTEKLAPSEEQTVRRNFVEERLETSDDTEDGPDDEVDQAAAEAVAAFQRRILDGQKPGKALEETLDEVEPESIVDEKPPAKLSDQPVELTDRTVHLNRQPAPVEVSATAETPLVKTKTRRPASPLVPAVESAWPKQTGFYNKNISAAGGRPGATFNPEYVPVRDELLLRHLPGGIVGYIMGRRRGRAKAERQMMPIQRKLENQVEKLEKEIVDKEIQIRRRVYELSGKNPAEAQSRAETATPPRRVIAEVEPVSAEAITTGKQAPEALGHIAVDAEKMPSTKSKPEAAGAGRKLDSRPVEALPRTELLKISEEIVIDGTNLRRIYETHLVGEQGLRRLVKEQLRGGDIKKALRQEILEREIDFERDPILRDRAKSAAGSGTAALQQLLQEAKLNAAESSEEAAFYKARAAFEADQQTSRQKRRRMMDAGMVVTIMVLFTVVLLLYLNRR